MIFLGQDRDIQRLETFWDNPKFLTILTNLCGMPTQAVTNSIEIQRNVVDLQEETLDELGEGEERGAG